MGITRVVLPVDPRSFRRAQNPHRPRAHRLRDSGGLRRHSSANRPGEERRPAQCPSQERVRPVLHSNRLDRELFSDTLPLQVFNTFGTEAIFLGTGAVIDVASFEVTGATGEGALGFNGRTAVNGDGTIPRLPELVLFVVPDGSAASPKQTVSVDLGSKRDEGRFVVLLALNRSLRVLDFDFVQVTPQMQTLTVSSATPEIVIMALFGEPELKILVVDNLTYNRGRLGFSFCGRLFKSSSCSGDNGPSGRSSVAPSSPLSRGFCRSRKSPSAPSAS